ncbi:hypothetical protein ACWD6I_24335, partial [Streptomyces sp. NPDC002454]
GEAHRLAALPGRREMVAARIVDQVSHVATVDPGRSPVGVEEHPAVVGSGVHTGIARAPARRGRRRGLLARPVRSAVATGALL